MPATSTQERAVRLEPLRSLAGSAEARGRVRAQVLEGPAGIGAGAGRRWARLREAEKKFRERRHAGIAAAGTAYGPFLIRQGRFPEAITQLQEVVKRFPDTAEARRSSWVGPYWKQARPRPQQRTWSGRSRWRRRRDRRTCCWPRPTCEPGRPAMPRYTSNWRRNMRRRRNRPPMNADERR